MFSVFFFALFFFCAFSFFFVLLEKTDDRVKQKVREKKVPPSSFLLLHPLSSSFLLPSSMVKIHAEYVSGGCNHSAHALDADYSQDVIVCASHRNVFELEIYAKKNGCAQRTTVFGEEEESDEKTQEQRKHQTPVTCVKIVEKNTLDDGENKSTIVLSADTSGTVIAWTLEQSREDKKRKWTQKANCMHSFGPITQIAAKRETSESVIVATVASDDHLRLWSLNIKNWTMVQVNEKAFPSQHRPMCVDISDCVSTSPSSPSSSRFVAVGCADGTTRFYALDTKAFTDFEFIAELVGHEDWVRDTKFQSLTTSDDTTSLFLATCSQDKNARVWKIIARNNKGGESETNKRLPFETLAAPPRPPSEVLKGARVDIQLEALLCGHEDWVFTCAWRPSTSDDNSTSSSRCHQLLTASADRSVNLWSPSMDGEADSTGTSLWFSLASLGEAGDNCLGYRGASFYGRNCFIAHSQSGALHAWEFMEELQAWESLSVNSGHTDKIRALVWDNDGKYFLTGSDDHTTRLIGYWNTGECDNTNAIRTPKGWREIARPQTHGHAISCLAVVPPSKNRESGKTNSDSSQNKILSNSSQSFISGSSEKALRAFRAPRVFWERMKVGNTNVDNVNALILSGQGAAEASALGLSNKGVHNNNNENVDVNLELLEEELSKASLDAKHGGAIVEEYLVTNTLWPETSKLYGHGDDVFSVAAHPSGRLLASAAKGTKEATAEILLWEHNETHNDWRMVESLLGPTLTAVALEFSNDGGTLIVASRDRHACIFTRTLDDTTDLSEGWILTNRFKAHAREMYDLTFLNDNLFITVGRDKKANVWRIHASSEGEMRPVWSSESLCSSAPTCVSVLNSSTFATGHENGSIKIWTKTKEDDAKWSVAGDIPNAHCAEVTKVAFKPAKCAGESENILATCGADHVTRVFRIEL